MARIEELDGQIKGKIAQLRDQQSTDSNQKKQNLAIFAEQVTKEMVEKLNKILENKSPRTLIDILETFIALLRNNEHTKPVDVELFFADANKLSSKMGRHKTTDVDLELAMASKQKLEPIARQDDLG